MKEIKIKIEGTTGLLMNKMPYLTQQTEQALKSKFSAYDDVFTEAAKKIHYSSTDFITAVMPAANIMACFVEAGELFKIGKKQISTKTTTLLTGWISFDDIEYPILTKNGWHPETMPVINQNTRGMILSVRPLWREWAIEFKIYVRNEKIDIKVIRELIDEAGMSKGLGSYRPPHKGLFGKFKVIKWEVLN